MVRVRVRVGLRLRLGLGLGLGSGLGLGQFRVQSLFEPRRKRQAGWDSPIGQMGRTVRCRVVEFVSGNVGK